MTISVREAGIPQTVPKNPPSTNVLPSTSRPSADAGLTEVKHPGHPYYFMIPGGQVFTIAPTG